VIPGESLDKIKLEDNRSSGKVYDELEEPDLMLKKVKSSIPFKAGDRDMRDYTLEHDRSVG
jgi:hypothetical protein